MRARARWHVLFGIPVLGALVMIALWAMQDQQARGHAQVRSGARQVQLNPGNHYSSDPTRTYEACVTNSSCFGGQQIFWSRTATLMRAHTR